MKKKELVLDILGWIFIIMGVASVGWHVIFLKWEYAIWFCNHSMLITGTAVLMRNRFWLTAMLNWSVIPITVWMIDFIGKLFFNVYIFRVTEYMFEGPSWGHIISMQHLFAVPLMIYALYLLGKPDKWAWLGTLLQSAILFSISYFFITPDYNINCAHTACISWLQNLPHYPIVWFLLTLGMFIVTNWLLVWIFSGREARRSRTA
jgi:hypothetical protein